MPLAVPMATRVLKKLRPGRGHLDERPLAPNALTGYLFLPDQELRSVRVYVNGTLLGSAEMQLRPDVAEAYPWFPHARRCGYCVEVKPGLVRTDRVNRVSVLGYQDRKPLAYLNTLWFPKEVIPAVPIPPPRFIQRVQGSRDRELYQTLGFRYCQQLLDALARHRDPHSVRRLLDFGCGCGRLAAQFLADPNRFEVYGCDVDGEALAWCRKHLPAGHFTRTDLGSPLPYPDETFDVVVALSVLTGSGTEGSIKAALAEVRRALAPGGLFLCSVQGPFSALWHYPPHVLPELLRDGIFENDRHQAWAEEMALGECRGTFQTREYTFREWSKYFDILEYLEAEINTDQDLVVMRRSAGGQGR